MSRLTRSMLYICVLFVLLTVLPANISAQGIPGSMLLRETNQGLEIVSLNPDGSIQAVLHTFLDFGFLPDSGKEWLLHPGSESPGVPPRTASELALSPDGQKLAFMVIKDWTTFRLVIYRLDTQQVIEKDFENLFYLDWSPDSTELLLAAVNVPYVPDGDHYANSSIYNLDADTFRDIIEDPTALWWNFQWLSHTEYILYGRGRTLYLTDSQGSFHRLLVDVSELDLAPHADGLIEFRENKTPGICNSEQTWNPLTRRIYFVACADSTDFLYSVDLEGNLRFEFSLLEHYAEERTIVSIPVSISGIFPDQSSNEVFIAGGIPTQGTPEDPQTRYTLSIQRVVDSQRVETIYERTPPTAESIGISTSTLSPQGDKIAFMGGSQMREESHAVFVVDLETGDVLVEQTGLSGICDVDWISSDVVAYEEISRLNCSSERVAVRTHTINIDTGETTVLYDGLSVVVPPTWYPDIHP